MLDKISKILLLIGILSLIGCSTIDRKTCINHFNNRVFILTKDSQINWCITRLSLIHI